MIFLPLETQALLYIIKVGVLTSKICSRNPNQSLGVVN